MSNKLNKHESKTSKQLFRGTFPVTQQEIERVMHRAARVRKYRRVLRAIARAKCV